jgi:hypothetical protein
VESSEALVPPEANVPIRIRLLVGNREPLKRATLRLIPSSPSFGDIITSCASRLVDKKIPLRRRKGTKNRKDKREEGKEEKDRLSRSSAIWFLAALFT